MCSFLPQASHHLLLSFVPIQIVSPVRSLNISQGLGPVQFHGAFFKGMSLIRKIAASFHINPAEEVDYPAKAGEVHLHIVMDG